MNLTVVSLALVSSLKDSPLLAPNRALFTKLKDLKFSRIAHPIFFSSVPQTLFIQSLHLSYCLSTAFICNKIPVNPDTPVKTGCYYGDELKISWSSPSAGLSFLSGNVTLTNCTFYECKGTSTFTLRQSAIYCSGTSFAKSNRLFDVDTPVNGSYLLNCRVSDMSSNLLYLKDGSFTVSNTTFSQSTAFGENEEDNCLLYFTQGGQIKINGCTFTTDKEGIWSIRTIATNTLHVTGCSFNIKAESKTLDLKNTYAIISHSCSTEEDFIKEDGQSVLQEGDGNEFNASSCPVTVITTPLSDEKKARATATAIVFIAAFTILFVMLIVCVFCKKENGQEEQYKSLNEVDNAQNSDDDVPSG